MTAMCPPSALRAPVSREAAPPLPVALGERPRAAARANGSVLAVLALGHLIVDTYQGALPALLPFLKTAHGLSYAGAGAVLLVANVTSSLLQPIFGYWSDRTPRRFVLPWALVLAAAGVALVGFASDYLALLGLVVVAGLGVAAYHPEGYRTAHQAAGARKATGLAFFSLGGNVGIALGPPAVTLLVTRFGLPGTLGMLAPGLVVAGLVALALPTLSPAAPGASERTTRAGGRNRPGAMGLLIGVVTVRSWTQLGLVTFVPFLYVDLLRLDPGLVGPLLFAFLGAGALGTLVAGPIADRWGSRPYLVLSMLVTAPLLVAFLWLGGEGWVATALFTAAGFALVSSFSVTVALGQAYLPRHLGLAAGLIVGLAIGTGGVGVALLGWVADQFGLLATLWALPVLPVLGLGLALALPEPRD